MKQTKAIGESLKRVNKLSILFNDKELDAINNYCKRFKIKNRSKFMREAIISEVLKRFEDNHPTLWGDK